MEKSTTTAEAEILGLNAPSTTASDQPIAATVDKMIKMAQEEEDDALTRSRDEPEPVKGFKLAIIVASVALSCFLMLLDAMIVSTVSNTQTPLSRLEAL